MADHLRDRILRKLDGLSDERLYQVLDYVEFIQSKYAERQAPAAANAFQKFAEAVEDKMRAGRVPVATITETMGLMNKAMGVLNGVAAAGKSVANDLAGAAARAQAASTATRPPASGTAPPPGPPAPPPPSTTPPATPGEPQP
ncbi:MAG: hypothetical protein AVDCRST_MAG11-3496 [uncultured Gemmatimonadaceae bacterium]|uniref:DUF2281 domain-containing protein n=1 Tax=uncultured Gemmatimonadaceae bacterium TaxID=246130 RepID=A0A6J4M5G2_9BACT|nr:MAG: hypothetical protein AVDCRST_MAG11-3496 [uncultured Gemmatimonadaceae bacterium]